MTWRSSARCCRNAVRVSARTPTSTYLAQRRRWESTEAAGAGESKNPKITQIVDQISQLNLLETADLVSTLKVGRPHSIFLVLEPKLCMQGYTQWLNTDDVIY